MKSQGFKKFISVMLCTLLVLPVSAAKDAAATSDAVQKRYIVVLDVPAVHSPERPSVYGSSQRADALYRQELYDYCVSVKESIGEDSLSTFGTEENEGTSFIYTDVISGFSVDMTASQAQQVRQMDGVKCVLEDVEIFSIEEQDTDVYMSTTSTTDTTTYNVLNSATAIKTPEARELGYTGEGRTIAVIDTYIDPSHPYLSISDSTKVRYTQSSIEALIEGGTLNVTKTDGVYQTLKVPFVYDYCYGQSTIKFTNIHGLHVSGIAAGGPMNMNLNGGSGVIEGVAPEAQVLFMGVFTTSGTASLATIVAALDDAVKLDVDAINLSLGEDYASENNPGGAQLLLKSALESAENAGVSVVHAAGNNSRGDSYDTRIADYSVADNSFWPYGAQVGSVHSEYAYLTYLTDENSVEYPCEILSQVSGFSLTDLVDCGNGTTSLIDASTDKVAVITVREDAFGSLSLTPYAKRAESAGAKAVIFVSNTDFVLNGSVAVGIPLFYVQSSVGKRLLQNATQISFGAQAKVQKIYSAPRASDFSSYGVSDSLKASVDFSSPGGHVFSSVGSNRMAGLSGTSMAAPQVAGAMALLRQRIENDFPSYTGKAKTDLAKQLFSSTATGVYEENGALSPVRKVGAGLIDLQGALTTNVVAYSQDGQSPGVSVGDKVGDSFDVSFVAKNLSSTDTISFESVSAELTCEGYKYYPQRGVNGYISMIALDAAVAAPEAVTLSPGEEKIVSLTITPDAEKIEELEGVMTNGFFIDGRITLSQSDENCDVVVPFIAFRGDWASQPVFSDIQNGISVITIGSTGLTAVSKPRKTDEGYKLYFSDNMSPSLTDKGAYLCFDYVDRNVYTTMTGGGETLLDKEFFLKKQFREYALPSADFIADIEGGIDFLFELPYSEDGSHTQTLHIGIETDNESPTATLSYADEVATISASDNVGISTIIVRGKNVLGQTVVTKKEYNAKSATATFDVTNLQDPEFFVCDMAFNMISFPSGVYFEEADGVLTLKNMTKEAESGVLFKAKYEGTRLCDIESIDITELSPFGAYTVDTEGFEDSSCRFFFWDMTSEPLPIAVKK